MTEATITIDPTPERDPVLPQGTYGADGEAELSSLVAGTQKFGNFAGEPCLKMRIRLNVDGHGFLTLFHDWPMKGRPKNITLRMLRDLGVDLAAMARDADGSVSFDAAHLFGEKIIVELDREEWTDKNTGEPREKNVIKRVTKRA